LHLDPGHGSSRARTPNRTPHQTPRGTSYTDTPRRSLSARALPRARTDDPSLKHSISARLPSVQAGELEDNIGDSLKVRAEGSLAFRAEEPATGTSSPRWTAASLLPRDGWCPVLSSVHQGNPPPMTRSLQRSSSNGACISTRSQKAGQRSSISGSVGASPECSPRTSSRTLIHPGPSHLHDGGPVGGAAGEGKSGADPYVSLSARCPRTAAVIEHFRQRQRPSATAGSVQIATAAEERQRPLEQKTLGAGTWPADSTHAPEVAVRTLPTAVKAPTIPSSVTPVDVPPLAEIVTVLSLADDQQSSYEVPLSARLVPAELHDPKCRGLDSLDMGDGGTGSDDASSELRQQLSLALAENERLREEGRRRGAWGDAGPEPEVHEATCVAQRPSQSTLRWECPTASEEDLRGSQVDYMAQTLRSPSIHARDGGSV